MDRFLQVRKARPNIEDSREPQSSYIISAFCNVILILIFSENDDVVNKTNNDILTNNSSWWKES